MADRHEQSTGATNAEETTTRPMASLVTHAVATANDTTTTSPTKMLLYDNNNCSHTTSRVVVEQNDDEDKKKERQMLWLWLQLSSCGNNYYEFYGSRIWLSRL